MILESTATLLTSPTTTMTSTTTSLEPPGSFSINFRLFTLYTFYSQNFEHTAHVIC